ncbi:MAG: hypothetical protein JWO73_811 [Candidatus Taylorbacteria bacterium]|nr:hypothetical protein [Candidatus Taylorbacteria bacterium]
MSSILFELFHGFVNTFASGRSTIKLFLFVAILLLFACWNLLIRKNNFSFSEKIRTWTLNAFWISIFGGFAWGIFGTFCLYSELSLPLRDTLLIMSRHSISTTQFFHTHVMKIAAGFLANLFSVSSLNADLGTAFLNFLPSYFTVISVAFFFAVSISGISVLFVLWEKNRHSLLKQLLSLILVFSVVKNVVDGGFLNYEAIPALITLWIIAYGTSWKRSSAVMITLAMSIFLFAFWGCSIGLLDIAGFAKYLKHSFTLFALYIGIFGLSEQGLAKRLPILLCSIGALGVIYTGIYSSVDDLSYTRMSISGTTAYLGTYSKSFKGTKIDQVGELSLYKIQAKEPLVVDDILKEGGDNSTYFPVSIEWNTCFPQKEIRRTADLISLEPISISKITHESMRIDSARLIARDGRFYRYSVTFSVAGCLPRPLNFLHEILRESGVTDAVLFSDLNKEYE